MTAAITKISDEQFGRAFVRRAVTPRRIEAALAGLAEKRIGLGPFSSGPVGLARIAAEGRLCAPRVSERGGDELTFAVTVPATIDFAVRLGAETTLRADVEVDLVLTPRPADPLLIAIDIAPVRGDDVRIALHGTGIAQSVTSLLAGVTDEVGRHVARQVTAVVDGEGMRRSRTIDVAARIDGRPDAAPPTTWQFIDHAVFGGRIIEHTVTQKRLAKGFARLTGQDIAIGPMQTGPRDLATVRASGKVGEPRVSERPGGFDAVVPVHLDLTVDVKRANRYDVDVQIPLRVTPTPVAPLQILIDVAPVAAGDVRADVRPRGALAGLLGKVGHLQEQVQRQVAKHVNARLAEPGNRLVDIGARVDGTS